MLTCLLPPSARQWANSPCRLLCLHLLRSLLTPLGVQSTLLASNIDFLLVDFYMVYLESFCPPGLTSVTPELAPKHTSYCLLWLWTTAGAGQGQRVGFLCCKTAACLQGSGSVLLTFPTLWVSLTLLVPLVLAPYPCWLSHHRGQALDTSHAAFPGNREGGEAPSARASPISEKKKHLIFCGCWSSTFCQH